MKRVIGATLILAAAATGAQEPPLDDRWYVGITGGVARTGADRLTDDYAGYYGAYLGRFFSDNVSLDLQLDAYDAEFDSDNFARIAIVPAPTFDRDFDLRAVGLTGRYHLGQAGQTHRPYGLVGLGIQDHDNFLDDGRDVYVSAGVGLRSELGRNLSLRAQLEGRYDNDRATFDSSGGFIDFIASVGLTFAFGEPPEPPAPEPAREPRAAPAEPAPRPASPAPEPEDREVLFDFDATVFFAFDSAELRPEARTELDRAAGVLEPRDEIILIEVAGHTDDIGTEAYNQDLSERRARSVADYLENRGVDRDRMRIVGYGESRPRVPNTSPENRQQNRRVVISVIDRED